jgi:signal peptidase I
VIGLPGDVVWIERKEVFVNGKKLTEPYVQHTRPNEMLVGDNLVVGKVPEGHVFVLGDNRDQSEDSRDWKDPASGKLILFVPRELIKGRLIFSEN